MASYPPYVVLPLTDAELSSGARTEEQVAEHLASQEPHRRAWMACSRYDWFQKTIGRLVEAHPEYEALRYATLRSAILRHSELPDRISTWRKLLLDLDREPERIKADTGWTGLGSDEVLSLFRRASAARNIHEELMDSLPALFSFLKSQPVALQEAYDDGKGVFCIQFH